MIKIFKEIIEIFRDGIKNIPEKIKKEIENFVYNRE